VAFYAAPAASGPLNVAPTVYPPLFFVLLVPLTALPPWLGLALWLSVSLVAAFAALYGAWRIVAAGRPPWGLLVSALSCAPLILGLLLGQVEGLLLYALYRAYRAFVRERDLAAGLWIGLLCLKPQYALFLALVLAFKRRWLAVAGMLAVAGAIAALSLAAIGWDAVQRYRAMLLEATMFRPPADAAAHAPGDMVSWRGLLYNVLPGTAQTQGLVLTLLLSSITVLALPVIWRGAWQPRDRRFAPRLLGTILVTMLASFHNHLHGAALVALPAIAVAAQGSGVALRIPLLLGLYLPSAAYLLTGDVALVSQVLAALMAAALLVVVVQETFPQEQRAPAPVHAALAIDAGRVDAAPGGPASAYNRLPHEERKRAGRLRRPPTAELTHDHR
jgi:hypothetical protein